MSQILTQMGKGNIFIVDSEGNKRRKYKRFVQGPESNNFGDPSQVLGVLKIKLNQLVDVFVDELKNNLINNKSNLINFKLFSCLKPEELSYLAKRALKDEYYEHEIILEDGFTPCDKFYLIV